MGWCCMKKLDNFLSALGDLQQSRRDFADTDVIYRMGVIGQFNFCVELAWKALQGALRLHGVQGAETGSPREILKLGFSVGFVDDEAVWLDMLKRRNLSVHVYDEGKAEELVGYIYTSYIPAFARLAGTLQEKVKEIE